MNSSSTTYSPTDSQLQIHLFSWKKCDDSWKLIIDGLNLEIKKGCHWEIVLLLFNKWTHHKATLHREMRPNIHLGRTLLNLNFYFCYLFLEIILFNELSIYYYLLNNLFSSWFVLANLVGQILLKNNPYVEKWSINHGEHTFEGSSDSVGSARRTWINDEYNRRVANLNAHVTWA